MSDKLTQGAAGNICSYVPVLKKSMKKVLSKLELKIPPVLVTILFASMMWGLALAATPSNALESATSVLSAVLVVMGGVFVLSGVVAFRKAMTTVNPTRPEASSALVTTGVYRYTRNPMYVGFLFFLIGWGVFLANAYAMTLAIGFVGYMNRFQIHPEERVLESIFGAEFLAYKTRVRRWL